jgi:glycine oxidase
MNNQASNNQASRVAIAGAGIIGASIAWRLSQAGIAVTLFDAGVLGGEASSAAAGMLSPGGEFGKPSHWLDLGLAGMRLYPAFVEELRAESGLPIDFQICGCAHLADTEEERRAAHARAEFQSRAGIRVEVTREGLYYPEDGLVDPVDLLRSLRVACESRYVRIVEKQPLEEIESSAYAAVVIAAGAWSGQIRVRYRNQPVTIPGTTPVKGHLIGFDLEPGTLGAMRRHGSTYVLQRANGFTIAGSTEQQAGFDRTVDAALCEEIHRRAAALFARLADLKPSRRWIGFRPQSAFGQGPHIGRVEGTNVWLAYGHYRHGILLAPLTAERIAGEVISSLGFSSQ